LTATSLLTLQGAPLEGTYQRNLRKKYGGRYDKEGTIQGGQLGPSKPRAPEGKIPGRGGLNDARNDPICWARRVNDSLRTRRCIGGRAGQP